MIFHQTLSKLKAIARARLDKTLNIEGRIRNPLRSSMFDEHHQLVHALYDSPITSQEFQLSHRWLNHLKEAFYTLKIVGKKKTTAGPEWICDSGDRDYYHRMNQWFTWRDPIPLIPILSDVISEYNEPISQYVKSPFVIVNVEAFETLPTGNAYGPSEWHSDGYMAGHLKLMIYLNEMDEKSGSFQLEGSRIVRAPAGTVLIFKNSDVQHRGIRPSATTPRPVIQCTLFRTLIEPQGPRIIVPSNNDRHFISPFLGYQLHQFLSLPNWKLHPQIPTAVISSLHHHR